MGERASAPRVPRRAFRGADLPEVGARARAALGDDALILSTRVLRGAAGPVVEVVAAAARDVRRFEQAVTPLPLPDGRAAAEAGAAARRGAAAWARVARRSPGAARPSYVVALVGPTGAGKTTTAAKLATSAAAFGGRRVGLLTLDTYRAGAVAQLEAFADVAGMPLEVAYDARDAVGALARLADRDVVVVDTPGRGPREPDGGRRAALDALAPDEVHLVLPATVRPDLGEHARDAYDADAGGGARLSHLLLTKLDEVPGAAGVADLAMRLALPARWVGDGQGVPADLAAAVPRLLDALGAPAGAERTWAAARAEGGR